MADLRKYSRAFVTELIELYRDLPSIWMVKSKDYSNRDLKSQSYEILVEKFKEVEPNADRDFVIKKIKNMRDVWRRQNDKIEKCLKSGVAVEDIPTPSLWYYDLLNFLKDQETTRSSMSNISAGNESQVTNNEDFEINENSEVHSVSYSETNSPATSTASTTTSRGSKKKRPREDLLAKINAHLSEPIPTDRWEHAAKSWAGIIRSLPKQQQIFAEKLINDVLFEAQMNSLCRQSRIDVNINFITPLPAQHENFQNIYNSDNIDNTLSQTLLVDPVTGQLMLPATNIDQRKNTQPPAIIGETQLPNSNDQSLSSQKMTIYYSNFKP